MLPYNTAKSIIESGKYDKKIMTAELDTLHKYKRITDAQYNELIAMTEED